MWIVGDSHVHWAARQALQRGDVELQIDVWGDLLTWKGRRGAKLIGAIDLLQEFLDSAKSGVPDLIIFHLGCNDFLDRPKLGFHLMVRNLIEFCQFMLPNTIIVWSSILPRPVYRGVDDQGGLSAKLSEINRNACKLFIKAGGRAIGHPRISRRGELFREDDVHLNTCGLNLFLDSLRDALDYFHLYPTAVKYPGLV